MAEQSHEKRRRKEEREKVMMEKDAPDPHVHGVVLFRGAHYQFSKGEGW